jgi:hypothetical protein
MAIPGFGKRKAEAYGEEIMVITGKFERHTSFPLDWVAAEVAESDFEAWIIEQRRSREQLEQQKIFQRKQVLEGVAAGSSLAELEGSTGMKRQELVRLVEDLDKNGYDMEPLVELELTHVAADLTEKVKELYAALGDRFLKPVMKALYTEEELKDMDANDIYEKLRLHRIRFRHERNNAAEEEGGAQAAV